MFNRCPVVRTGVVLLLAVGCASAGCSSNDGTTIEASTTSVVASPSPSPLLGEWASGSIPASDIRAVVLDAGFTRDDADQVLRRARTFEFTLLFEGDRSALTSSRDGKDEKELESGPYGVVGQDQLRLGIGDTGDSLLFAFHLDDDQLTLTLLENAETGTAEDKYTHSYFTTAYYTGHSFTKTQ